MTLMHNSKYLVEGEYYVCYEIFSRGTKNVAIGVLNDSRLYGQYISSQLVSRNYNTSSSYTNVNGRYPWHMYDGATPSEHDGSIQYVFRLTEEEVIKHVILENI